MDNTETFCRQVRARSAENQRAVAALAAAPGQLVSILRQELDSLVRVVFLLAQADTQYRKRLITESVAGKRWLRRHARQPVTDREMVELTNKRHGWTKSV
jgi:hypothetical protein